MTGAAIFGLSVVVAFVAFGAGAYWVNQFKQAKKRFGLNEAEAAMRWIRDKAHVQSVLAVACGVLGYENKVAEDASVTIKHFDFRNEERDQNVAFKISMIERIGAEIEDLKMQISSTNTRAAEVKELAELFKI